MSDFSALEAIEHFKAANAELREELKQAYALGIYKGTDGLLRNSWQQEVEKLNLRIERMDTEIRTLIRENKNLEDRLDAANKEAWHDRM